MNISANNAEHAISNLRHCLYSRPNAQVINLTFPAPPNDNRCIPQGSRWNKPCISCRRNAVSVQV